MIHTMLLEKNTTPHLLPKLSQEDLHRLLVKENIKPGVTVILVFIFITFVLAIYTLLPNAFTFSICFILIAGLQHHISVIQHEAVHYNLFTNRFLNNFVGSIAAYSTFFTMNYRKTHFMHHEYLGKETDPDLDKYKNYPNILSYIVRDLLKNITGFEALTQTLRENIFPKLQAESNKRTFDLQIIGILLTQLILFIALWQLSLFYTYFLLWVLPLGTLTKTLIHFRNVAEHAFLKDLGDPEISRYRTILCNPVEGFFFAPLNFNYHAEHHLYTSIPYYNLPEAQRILSKQKEYYNSIDLRFGYLKFIFSSVIQRQFK